MAIKKFNYTRPACYDKQLEILDCEERNCIVEATTKGGKAQPLDSIVYTPNGPKKIGDIKSGDFVFSEQGLPIMVTGVFPQGKKDIYKVRFSDRSTTECCSEHLWEVFKTKRKTRIFSLNQIMKYSKKEIRHLSVSKILPVQFNNKNILIDPYLMGVLLGDGSFKDSVKITSKDKFIIDKISTRLPKDYSLVYINRFDYRITAEKNSAKLREQKKSLPCYLKTYNLKGCGSKEKFIPNDYKYNSVSIRLNLLQGIFDTDGYVSKGQPMIELISKRLIDDIAEVCQSLGFYVKKSFKENNGYKKDGVFIKCQSVYRLSVLCEDSSILFSLPYKKDRCTKKKKPVRRNFKSFEYVGKKESVCISVDNPRQLYLTDNFIPTHNTTVCIIWIFEQALQGKAGNNCWWIAPTKATAKIAFERLKRMLGNDRRLFRQSLTELRIILPNEVSIWFKGGDSPDSLYGEDVIAAVIDEGTRLKKESFYAVRSTQTATNGKMRIIGNVKGRGNWVYKLARRAEKSVGKPDEEKEVKGWHYVKITVHDAIAAGVFSQEEFDQAKEDLPEEVIRELYEAEALDDRGRPFLWGFSEERNVIDSYEVDQSLPIYASFDFNVDPMTCTLSQYDIYNYEWAVTFDEIKLKDSDIYEMCKEIEQRNIWGCDIIVNGDASGRSRYGGLRKGENYYTIIRQELGLSKRAIQVGAANPTHDNSRLLSNSLFRKHPFFKIVKTCIHTIADIKFTQADEKGGIDKTDEERTHFLDNVRYFHWQNFKKWIKKYLPSSDDTEQDEPIEE